MTATKLGKIILLSTLLIWALVNIGNLFLRPITLADYYQFWFSGQYLRQNIDPYTTFSKDTNRQNSTQGDVAFVRGDALTFPIHYLDGAEDTQASLYEVAATKSTVPANTAPMILLISLLSYFSWPLSGGIWFFASLMMGFGLIWLVLHYVEQGGLSITPFGKLTAFLLFWGLDAARSSLQQGQTTIAVLFLGFLALYLIDRKHPVWAGVILGIALSKYNVCLPIFLLVLYKRGFKTITIAFLVQLIATLSVSLLTHTAVLDIIQSYAGLAVFSATISNSRHFGVNLGAYLQSGALNIFINGFLFAALLLYLFRRSPKGMGQFTAEQTRLLDIHILSIFALWGLLGVYHLKYDIISIVIYLYLFALAASQGQWWNLSHEQARRFTVITLIVLIPLFFSFPLSFLFRDEGIRRLIFSMQTLSLVALLVSNFWLYSRFLAQQPVPDEVHGHSSHEAARRMWLSSSNE
jgi:Glycosyltransferase family 87